jgi:hypothetical protein
MSSPLRHAGYPTDTDSPALPNLDKYATVTSQLSPRPTGLTAM